jgi:Na+/H+-translocating membrane pyrophosphatase
MSTASRAGEEAVRAAKAAQEGISRASRLAYRQGAEAGEYVGSLVKSDLLLTLSGAGALGFALGLLVARR